MATNTEPYTNEERDQIATLYEQGLTGGAIAEHIGRSRASVYTQIRKLNLRRPHRGLAARRDEVLALYGRGLSGMEVADRVGYTYSAIHKLLRDAGVTRDKRTLDHTSERAICSRYENGESSPALAQAFGLSDSGIRKLLHRNNIPTRPPQPRLTEAQRQTIIDRYEDGQSVPDIARELGHSTGTIYPILRAAAATRPRRALSDEDAERVCRRYEAGETMASLGREYECGTVAIRGALTRAGVEMRGRGRTRPSPTDDEVAEIVRLYAADGMTQAAIGEKVGLSAVTISRTLRAAGVVTGAPRGSRHGNWKGGRLDVNGYVCVFVDDDNPLASMRNSMGYAPEHRLVMARHLGRPLLPHPLESVHHKNGDHSDNRLGNLQLRSDQHGKGVVLRCADCGSRHIEADEL